MKELTIGQKAKLYDEVVNKLKGFMAQGVDPLITRADVQDFFPELKENEDEKIREALLEHIKGIKSWEYFLGISKEQMIDWLDKQGEQNPAWSEEDDRMMNDTLAVVDWYAGKHRNISVKVSNWLKLLKNRVLSSSLREFDKEEGNVIDHLIAICDDAMCYDTFAGCSKKDIEKYKTFLTYLKFGIDPQKKQRKLSDE